MNQLTRELSMADVQEGEFADGEVIEQGEKGDNFAGLGQVDCLVDGVGKVMSIPGGRRLQRLALLYNGAARRRASPSAVRGRMVTGVQVNPHGLGSKSGCCSSRSSRRCQFTVLNARKRSTLDVAASGLRSEVIMTEGEAGDAFIVEEGEVMARRSSTARRLTSRTSSARARSLGSSRSSTPRAARSRRRHVVRQDHARRPRVMGSLKEMLKSNNELYAKYALGVQM